jgi:hypothetical protein
VNGSPAATQNTYINLIKIIIYREELVGKIKE